MNLSNFALTDELIELKPISKINPEDLAQQANDPEISKLTFNLPFPYTIEHAKSFLEISEKSENKGHSHRKAIYLKEKNQFCGLIALEKITQEFSQGTIGYWLGKEFWGRGIISRAIGLLLAENSQSLKLKSIHAEVFSENLASIKALLKRGFEIKGFKPNSLYKNQVAFHEVILQLDAAKADEKTATSAVKPGIYQHYKGKKYLVYGTVRKSDDLNEEVLYQGLYQDQEVGDFPMWTRAVSDFLSSVEVDGKSVPRFVKL